MITYPNLYHIKYFVDAVAYGSISKAAEKNLVTHPAISRSILALEKHLGISLLEHQKKSFKLTEAGYVVAEQCKILLSAASEFGTLSLKSKNDEKTHLKIGVSRTLSEVYLNPLLQTLKLNFPNVTAKVRFGTTNEIVEATANHSIDLGLTIGTLNLATLKQSVVQKGQFVLVESGPKKNWHNDIENKPFIVTEPRLETEKLKAAYQRQFSRPLPILYEISSWDVIGQLTQKGLGIGLLPDISIKKWPKNSYRIIKSFDFECSYEIYVHASKVSGYHHAVELVRDNLLSRTKTKATRLAGNRHQYT